MPEQLHFVLIEGDEFDRKCAVKDFKSRFPGAEISEFKTVKDFLTSLPTLKKADVVVMECLLNLIGDEDGSQTEAEFKENFFDLYRNWDGVEGAETVISYMRNNGRTDPVLIYAHSDERRIDREILDMENVYYLRKDINSHELSGFISDTILKSTKPAER